MTSTVGPHRRGGQRLNTHERVTSEGIETSVGILRIRSSSRFRETSVVDEEWSRDRVVIYISIDLDHVSLLHLWNKYSDSDTVVP